MMPYSCFYGKYLQSYDLYCNSMQTKPEDFRWPVGRLRAPQLRVSRLCQVDLYHVLAEASTIPFYKIAATQGQL